MGRLAYGCSAASRPGSTTALPGSHGQSTTSTRSAVAICSARRSAWTNVDLRQRPPSRLQRGQVRQVTVRPGIEADQVIVTAALGLHETTPAWNSSPKRSATAGASIGAGVRATARSATASSTRASSAAFPRQAPAGALDVLEHQHNPAVFVEEPAASWRTFGKRGEQMRRARWMPGTGVEFGPSRLDEGTRPDRCLQPVQPHLGEAPGCVTASTTRPPSCCSTAYRNPAGTEGHAIRTPAAGGDASTPSPSPTDVPALAPLIRS